MPFKFNPLSGNLDIVGMTASEKAAYLKLNQTTPQTVTNGTPTFSQGITATATGDTAITANKDIVIRAGRKLIFDGA